jgi:hypothetical protein
LSMVLSSCAAHTLTNTEGENVSQKSISDAYQ